MYIHPLTALMRGFRVSTSHWGTCSSAPSLGHGSPFHQPTGDLQRLLLYLLIVGAEKARHYALKRCATQPEIQQLCRGHGPHWNPSGRRKATSFPKREYNHNRPQSFKIQTLKAISQWSALCTQGTMGCWLG